MSRISFQRFAIAATLAAGLIFAAPIHAAGLIGWAPDGNLFQTAWQWVASFWAPQAIPGHHGVRSTAGESRSSVDPNGAKSDRGAGIDPEGTPSSATTCLTTLDRGCAVDPNG